MCDIMSASSDQNGSTPSTPEPRRHVTQIVLPDYESARTEARWTKKDPTKKHAAEMWRLPRNFHFSIYVAASADTPNPGLYSAWHLMFRRMHEVSNHFDDLANGARFKKRHCWGVRIWFDQPRKER